LTLKNIISSYYTPQYTPLPQQPIRTLKDLNESLSHQEATTNLKDNLLEQIVQILDDLNIANNNTKYNQDEFNLNNLFEADDSNNNLETENQEVSDHESINTIQEDELEVEINLDNQALRHAATAMTDLARALGISSKK